MSGIAMGGLDFDTHAGPSVCGRSLVETQSFPQLAFVTFLIFFQGNR